MSSLLRAVLLAVLTLAPSVAHGQLSDSLVLSLMEQYDVPGLSLASIQGDSVALHGWGYADIERTVPVSATTPFRIASVAKVFVAATVAQEVASGTIEFRDDISEVISTDGRFSGPITLHDLLTHTAGFDERLVGYGARSSDQMKPLGEYLNQRMPWRGWPVGEQISYSNHGMSLAGYVIEHAREVAFADLARVNIFDALGMHSTSFVSRGNRVPSNSADPLQCRDGICETLPHYFSHAYPAGLAFSTAHDMSRFISAMLEATERDSPLAVLIPERYTHEEGIPGMSYGFFNQYHQGVRFLSHAGSVPGYWSLIMISPEANLGFFFAANGGSSRFGERLRDELLSTLLEEEASVLSHRQPSDNPSLRAGVYESTRYSHHTIERFPQVFRNSIEVIADEDTLKIFSGGRLNKYVQIGETLYENIDGSDRIAFGTRRGKTRLFKTSFVYGAGLPEAYEKRFWYQAPGFLNEYVSWLLGAPIIVLLFLWPISVGINRYVRKKRGIEAHSFTLRSTGMWGLATLTSALFAVFGFGFVAQSNRMLESGELFFGVPDALLAISWIPVVHTGFATLMCVAILMAWIEPRWSVLQRLLFSLAAVLIVLQVIFFVQWNYMPIAW